MADSGGQLEAVRSWYAWTRDESGERLTMMPSALDAQNALAIMTEICSTLGARAAGYWRLELESNRLIQVAFVPGAGLDPDVGREFAAATVSVSLSQKDLGIVIAATTGQPAHSRVEELPADAGSGRWLRAFGATRSVAVPVRDQGGAVTGVVSVALIAEQPLDDRELVDRLTQKARG
jgi:hypothetical protein